MNALMIIKPYKYAGQWVFDDGATDLLREPFVAGIDTMIDKLTVNLKWASSGFKLLFSAGEFPNHDVRLDWQREDCGGNWYWCKDYNMEGWLCPALFKYFEVAPKHIFVSAVELQ
jgi:hypothetical protein